VAETNQEKIKKQKTQIEGYNLWLDQLWYQLMRTLAKLNGIREPKIYLIQVCWKIRWAYHNERPALRQQDYKPTQS
jgi:hypothetical protein